MNTIITLLCLTLLAAPVYYDDFKTFNQTKWQKVSGDWAQEGETLKGSSGGGDGLLFFGTKNFKNFTVECKIKVAHREGSLVFRALDKDNLYILVFNPKTAADAQGSILLIRRVKGKETYFGGAEVYVPLNEWTKIKVISEGKKIDVYMDGRFILSVDDDNLPFEGKVGLRVFGDFFSGCDANFDDFSVKENKQ